MKFDISRLRALVELTGQVRELARKVLTAKQLAIAGDYERMWEDARPEPEGQFGFPKVELAMRTTLLFAEAVDPDPELLTAIMLSLIGGEGLLDSGRIAADWGDDISRLVDGLVESAKFSRCGANVNQDNYRGLLLSLAGDIRIIIIMIVENLALMRLINHHPDEEGVRATAFEANCIYAQLAHRLGLYKIKGELEDLSLKYTNRDVYTSIARRLNETKKSRDAYIAAFIAPVKKRLEEAGLTFEIKGRTKSISSIWAKIKKQKVDIDHIYDLFAIRVIIDTPREKETKDCWLAYSILADMYMANPARMKDWISVPKSNGYESLHATVMGPQSHWVEVQFRTRRMDLVAEKGLAAHWRYKGGHGDSTDRWMNNVRDILETAEEGPMRLMRDMRADMYVDEVFAFTPKGDLLRLPGGATVLDFAFLIHSKVGSQCVGAMVNGRNRKITYKIHSGDTVEVVTSPQQSPKPDWLSIVVSPKARTKIKQCLGAERLRKAEEGKALLSRRLRNRKVELEESLLMRMIKKEGYKQANDFYCDLSDEKIDLNRFIAACVTAEEPKEEPERAAADTFKLAQLPEEPSDDILTIGDKTIRGMKYRFAQCCNPVHGDPVFGFISSEGIVKIHKTDCPNAANIRGRYPYRLINVRWSDTPAQGERTVTLRIVGKDDIGVVTNVTSIIAKDPYAALRRISIDSHDGMFSGDLTVSLAGNGGVKSLVHKILGVKGVKQVNIDN